MSMNLQSIQVINEATLSNQFLGDVIEICIVTRDYRRTMEGLVRLGIGPWRVYTFSPETVTEQTYLGEPAEFSIKVCFAQAKNVIWELMQPLSGPTIFQDFLDKHDEGIHHIAFDCGDKPWEERLQEFESRGFRLVQSGKWVDKNAFAFFATEDATTTIFETYFFPVDFEYPDPEEWFPAPPPKNHNHSY
ncbi:MAG: VOC family protein [Cyanobacteria bacterium P01_G01_bin.38]